MSPDAEEWREVPGWPGYMASDQGRVRSHRIDPLGRLLAVVVNPQNHYPTVGPSRYGKQTAVPVHVMVALAFHGARPPGMEVRHLDGSRDNNRPSNLAWGTHAENIQDAVRHGTHRSHWAEQTHCRAGHSYDEANTHVTPKGSRRCRCCDREQTAARRAGRRLVDESQELRAA